MHPHHIPSYVKFRYSRSIFWWKIRPILICTTFLVYLHLGCPEFFRNWSTSAYISSKKIWWNLFIFLQIWTIERLSNYPGFCSSLCYEKWVNGEGRNFKSKSESEGKFYGKVWNFPLWFWLWFEILTLRHLLICHSTVSCKILDNS